MQRRVLYSCGLRRVCVLCMSATLEAVVLLLAVAIAFPPFRISPKKRICLPFVFDFLFILVWVLLCEHGVGPAHLG